MGRLIERFWSQQRSVVVKGALLTWLLMTLKTGICCHPEADLARQRNSKGDIVMYSRISGHPVVSLILTNGNAFEDRSM